MDPEETLRLWRRARNEAEKLDHADNLRTWIQRGGFAPLWKMHERRKIMGSSKGRVYGL